MARLAFLLRLAVPLLLALATLFFRALLPILLALALAGFLFLTSRVLGKGRGKARPTTREGKKVIEGSYSIVDEEESPP